MSTLARLALGLAAVTVVAAVAVAVTAQPKKIDRPEQDDRFEVEITDEMIRHSRIRDVLYFVGVAWSFGTLAIVLVTRLSRRIRDSARKVSARPWLTAAIYGAILSVTLAVLDFPLNYYSGFVVPHQFDLTEQSFGGWMGDQAKGLAVGIVLSMIVAPLALFAIRRFRRWWLVLWAGSIPLILLMVVVQPVVLDPIFNDFQPLRDQVLRARLLDLASRAGIEGGRVYQVDKSKQTKTMNAYVNGIGPTSRIVMWDTLLAKMTHDEVLAVMGHEMGHYVLRHLWKGLAFSLAISFLIFLAGQRIHDAGLRRWGARWGVEAKGDPASVPWLLLIVGGISFLLSPVFAGYSRSIEHEADIFGLELTRLNEPMASAFVKLAEDSKRDPSPHPFIEFWRYSHPPIARRIPFALQYRPWVTGEENQKWREP
jgi:Zn-dependent protease with chaperone function